MSSGTEREKRTTAKILKDKIRNGQDVGSVVRKIIVTVDDVSEHSNYAVGNVN